MSIDGLGRNYEVFAIIKRRKYLFSKTWFLLVFAGIMGYIVYTKSAHTLDYLPSRILVTSVWSASVMWAGLVAGSGIGRKKN